MTMMPPKVPIRKVGSPGRGRSFSRSSREIPQDIRTIGLCVSVSTWSFVVVHKPHPFYEQPPEALRSTIKRCCFVSESGYKWSLCPNHRPFSANTPFDHNPFNLTNGYSTSGSTAGEGR